MTKKPAQKKAAAKRPSTARIGFVGVGRMGANMARHLNDLKYNVTAVFDVNEAAATELAKEIGATACKKLADVTANANAEMQGRIQVARVFQMTDDPGVRDLLSFLLARDTMHQNQWIRAAQELRDEGVEELPVPSTFPLSHEAREHSYQYINFSDGQAAADGGWASGPTPDGKGEFSYLDGPQTTVPMPPPTQPDPRFFGSDPKPAVVDKATGVVKDTFSQK